MAKNKVNNGLFDVSDLAATAKRNIEKRDTIHIHNTHTQQSYTMPQEETRSHRIQIVVKPSIGKELDRMAKENIIKSKNDLINYLIEEFVRENKSSGEKPVVRSDGSLEGQLSIDDMKE